MAMIDVDVDEMTESQAKSVLKEMIGALDEMDGDDTQAENDSWWTSLRHWVEDEKHYHSMINQYGREITLSSDDGIRWTAVDDKPVEGKSTDTISMTDIEKVN